MWLLRVVVDVVVGGYEVGTGAGRVLVGNRKDPIGSRYGDKAAPVVALAVDDGATEKFR